MVRVPPGLNLTDTLFPELPLCRSGAVGRGPSVSADAEAVQDGLGSWVEAGVAPPVRYDDGRAPAVDRDRIDDIVTDALIATRPDPSGRFPVPDFEILDRKSTRLNSSH